LQCEIARAVKTGLAKKKMDPAWTFAEKMQYQDFQKHGGRQPKGAADDSD